MLNEDRKLILRWQIGDITKDLNVGANIPKSKLSEVITPAGKASLQFLAIHRRVRRASLKQLTIAELDSIARFMVYHELPNIVRPLLAMNLPDNGSIAMPHLITTRNQTVTNVSRLSSKQIRLGKVEDSELMICVYKLGLILNPGELLAWTQRIKRLTSTRHRNILLRLAHGDIFSNSRLFKFGLKDSPRCENCPEAIESIQHRIIECPKALRSWQLLEESKRKLNLNNLSDLSIENLIGAKDRLNKIELALQAELILKLTSKSDTYFPEQMVRSTIMMVFNSEKLNDEMKAEFNNYKNEI